MQIPGAALRPRDGPLEIRITEELREVSYLDAGPPDRRGPPRGRRDLHERQVQGAAVPRVPAVRRAAANPAGCGARSPRSQPARAAAPARRPLLDGFHRGHRPAWRNGTRWISSSPLTPRPTAARSWSCTGGSTGPTAARSSAGAQNPATALAPPSLQVIDEAGPWRTVIEDMGMPAGNPKTIVVDLSGKFLLGRAPGSHRDEPVRLLGRDLPVRGDRPARSPSHAPPSRGRRAALPRVLARGDRPAPAKPEAFDYEDVLGTSLWNPTPGLYTRYGDVRELLAEVDDRLVVMGSGDELALRFGAGGLPPLPRRWTRDYLVFVDGWAKDGDPNTAFGRSVEPLPFHAMSGYPYGRDEGYPDDAAHRECRTRYQTRAARHLIPSLTRGEAERGLEDPHAPTRLV